MFNAYVPCVGELPTDIPHRNERVNEGDKKIHLVLKIGF